MEESKSFRSVPREIKEVGNDYLNARKNLDYVKLLCSDDPQGKYRTSLTLILIAFIIFSCSFKKLNRFGMSQHRNFIITSSALYNIHKNTINRKIRIRDIAGLTKSADAKNHEFIVHVEDDYDYTFPNTDAVLRDEFFENLKAAYFMARNKNLPVF